MHRSHASLTSYDEIIERQAYRQRQIEQNDGITPKTALVRPFSVDANELNYVQSITLPQQRLTSRFKRATSTVGIVQWTSSFVVKDVNEQRALIRYPDQFPVCSMHLAAMRIQRWWRSLDSSIRNKRSDRRLRTNPHWSHPYHCLIHYVTHATCNISHRSAFMLDMSSTESMLAYFDSCAAVIQRAYRAYRFRKFARYQRRMLYHKAAGSIQHAWRSHVDRQNMKERHFIDAVITIQRAWRSFSNRRVYRYFRSLIRSREASDPHQVLQSMGELDEASGLYIRFRLGGAHFPPLIYFKVFTKQPITDIGSFAPRNYALDERRRRERVKDVGAVQPFKSSKKVTEHVTDVSAWYRRYENNGWRLMSTLQLNTSTNQQTDDEITIRTSNIRTWHHPNKLVRAAEVIRKRKEKQISWKKSLYGLTSSSAQFDRDEKEYVTLPKLPPRGMHDSTDHEIPEFEDDDDLLDWCTSLSFDEYADVWSNIGTTSSQPQRLAVKLPYVNR